MKTQFAIRCFSVCVSAIVGTTAIAQTCQDNAACNDNDPCTFDRCDGGACSNTLAVYGDIVGRPGLDLECEPDGSVDLLDIIAVWEGFKGELEATIPGCSMRNADISSSSGCGADGKVDLYDMFAAIDAFNGVYNCCSSCSSNAECDDEVYCNGTETCDTTCQPGWANGPCRNQQCDNVTESCVAGSAKITSVVSTEGAWPGTLVSVDLYLGDVVGIAAYQVGIEVTRTSGSGSLECADELCAYVFPDTPETIFPSGGNISFGDDGSVRIVGVSGRTWENTDIGSTPAYLGTFTLKVSKDATPGATFEISIRTDQLLLGSARNSIPYDVGSALVVTVPYPDCDADGLTDICELDCNARDGACNVSGCGTRIDCNENAVPDRCDLDNNTSEDRNENDIPDECEELVFNGCETKLTAARLPGYSFGLDVSLSGDRLAVGFTGYLGGSSSMSGAVAVYDRTGDGWVREAMLTASDVGENDHFGRDISLSGDYLAAGAIRQDNLGIEDLGAAYVFHRDGGVWTEQAKLLPSGPAYRFGFRLAISGDYLVVGVPFETQYGTSPGTAYVFRRDGTNWVQEAILMANDASELDGFGTTVSIAGDYLAIGAYGDDDACPENDDCNSGAVYVFRNTGTEWVQEAKLLASDVTGTNSFGNALSMSDDYLVVANRVDGEFADASGAAYVFKRSGTNWVQEAKLTAGDASDEHGFGLSVAINGDSVVVGTNNSTPGVGRVYLFRLEDTTWVQHNSFVSSDSSERDYFGRSVAVASGEVVVGAFLDGSPARYHVGRLSSGSVYIYDPAMDYDKLGGDVNQDGLVDLFDILAVLDGFAGVFDNGAFADVDIRTSDGGCGSDGVIGLQDILGVLDGFMGGN